MGAWRVDRIAAVTGPPLAPVTRVAVCPSHAPEPNAAASARWVLRGSAGHQRYVERSEKIALQAVQPGLGRSKASLAAMIPVRKSDAWWDLAQDERRAIFETVSRHTAVGLRYLPAIARRLYHSRDLGEPFDFITWFEYAPEDAPLFEELVATLRSTEEWKYVEREVDIRLSLMT
jgi:chlorite dismutase